MNYRILFFLLTGFFVNTTQACDFCMLGQGISPYLTSNGKGLTLDSTYIESDNVYDQSHKIDAHGAREAWLIYSLTGFYNFNEDWTGLISVPYALKTNVDYEDSTNTNPGSLVTGLADITLSGRYSFFRKHNMESTFVLGSIFGVKLPTGSTNNVVSTGPADRHSLPGTGSTDLDLGVSAAYSTASGYQLTGDLVYNLAGRGEWDGRAHQYGDSVNFSLKGFYRVWPRKAGQSARSFFLFTGPSGEWTGKEKGVQTDDGYNGGLTNDSSGGSMVFWDFGVYSLLGPTTILNTSFSKGIAYNMNYNGSFAPDPTEDYKIDVSLTLLF